MEEMIEILQGQTNLGICLGIKRLRDFGGRLGLAPQVMHGKQSQIQLEAPLRYTRVLQKKSQSCATIR